MEDWTNEEWMGRGGGRNMKRRVEGWQTGGCMAGWLRTWLDGWVDEWMGR